MLHRQLPWDIFLQHQARCLAPVHAPRLAMPRDHGSDLSVRKTSSCMTTMIETLTIVKMQSRLLTAVPVRRGADVDITAGGWARGERCLSTWWLKCEVREHLRQTGPCAPNGELLRSQVCRQPSPAFMRVLFSLSSLCLAVRVPRAEAGWAQRRDRTQKTKFSFEAGTSYNFREAAAPDVTQG